MPCLSGESPATRSLATQSHRPAVGTDPRNCVTLSTRRTLRRRQPGRCSVTQRECLVAVVRALRATPAASLLAFLIRAPEFLDSAERTRNDAPLFAVLLTVAMRAPFPPPPRNSSRSSVASSMVVVVAKRQPAQAFHQRRPAAPRTVADTISARVMPNGAHRPELPSARPAPANEQAPAPATHERRARNSRLERACWPGRRIAVRQLPGIGGLRRRASPGADQAEAAKG